MQSISFSSFIPSFLTLLILLLFFLHLLLPPFLIILLHYLLVAFVFLFLFTLILFPSFSLSFPSFSYSLLLFLNLPLFFSPSFLSLLIVIHLFPPSYSPSPFCSSSLSFWSAQLCVHGLKGLVVIPAWTVTCNIRFGFLVCDLPCCMVSVYEDKYAFRRYLWL